MKTGIMIAASLSIFLLIHPARALGEEDPGWTDPQRVAASQVILTGKVDAILPSVVEDRHLALVSIQKRLHAQSEGLLPESVRRIYVSLSGGEKDGKFPETVRKGRSYLFFLECEKGRRSWQVGECRPIDEKEGILPFDAKLLRALLEHVDPPAKRLIAEDTLFEEEIVEFHYDKGEEPPVLRKTDTKLRLEAGTTMLLEDVEPEDDAGGFHFVRAEGDFARYQTVFINKRRKAGLSLSSRSGSGKVYVYVRKSRNTGFYIERVHDITTFVIAHEFWKAVKRVYPDSKGDRIGGPFYNTTRISIAWDEEDLRLLVEMDMPHEQKTRQLGEPRDGYWILGNFNLRVDGAKDTIYLNIISAPTFSNGVLKGARPFGNLIRKEGEKLTPLYDPGDPMDVTVRMSCEGAMIEVLIKRKALDLDPKAEYFFWYADALSEEGSTMIQGRLRFGEEERKGE